MQNFLIPQLWGFISGAVLVVTIIAICIQWLRDKFDGDLDERTPFMKRWNKILLANVVFISIFMVTFLNYSMSKETDLKASYGGMYDNVRVNKGSKLVTNYVVLEAEDGKTYNMKVDRGKQNELNKLSKKEKENLILVVRKTPLFTFLIRVKQGKSE